MPKPCSNCADLLRLIDKMQRAIDRLEGVVKSRRQYERMSAISALSTAVSVPDYSMRLSTMPEWEYDVSSIATYDNYDKPTSAPITSVQHSAPQSDPEPDNYMANVGEDPPPWR